MTQCYPKIKSYNKKNNCEVYKFPGLNHNKYLLNSPSNSGLFNQGEFLATLDTELQCKDIKSTKTTNPKKS